MCTPSAPRGIGPLSPAITCHCQCVNSELRPSNWESGTGRRACGEVALFSFHSSVSLPLFSPSLRPSLALAGPHATTYRSDLCDLPRPLAPRAAGDGVSCRGVMRSVRPPRGAGGDREMEKGARRRRLQGNYTANRTHTHAHVADLKGR